MVESQPSKLSKMHGKLLILRRNVCICMQVGGVFRDLPSSSTLSNERFVRPFLNRLHLD